MKAFTNAPSTWEHRKIYPRENTSDTASTRSTCVEIMYSTADSAILVVFRGSLLLYYTLLVEYCCTPKYFVDLYCGYCQLLAVFRPVGTASTGTASTASTHSTKILSICAVCWEYEVYFDHLFVHHRFDNLIRILLQTAFTVHEWSHEWELKQIIRAKRVSNCYHIPKKKSVCVRLILVLEGSLKRYCCRTLRQYDTRYVLRTI